ncbi:TetR/AcrR family transcriptional regulator [Streptomyces sp. A7024]|uniref:TetR/AcrR family transcriptional regulator n=1 Tax=Streptomyces coryli TaxID=1128680 RepID=A0A6G4TRN1_9ACTN|nr:TetR/AcrR family transcriptional regulator [Streptomyces coryli]NGN62669.1 TetR/AcrR family transcriptional regulator [Streptomyces coryli]
MPRRKEPPTRDRLVDAGLRLLEDGGPESLSARKVCAEIGASSMAVYTYFDGMAGLYEALTLEAFARFDRRLAEAPRTTDPVQDVFAIGLAYRDYALAHPQRYRLMFGATAPGAGLPPVHDLTAERSASPAPIANASFEQLVTVVRRSMAAGRLREDDASAVAGQLWTMVHGFVLLEVSGWFGYDGQGVFDILAPHCVNLLVGLGDEREAAEGSMVAAAPDPETFRTPAPAAGALPGTRRGPRPRRPG